MYTTEQKGCQPIPILKIRNFKRACFISYPVGISYPDVANSQYSQMRWEAAIEPFKLYGDAAR